MLFFYLLGSKYIHLFHTLKMAFYCSLLSYQRGLFPLWLWLKYFLLCSLIRLLGFEKAASFENVTIGTCGPLTIRKLILRLLCRIMPFVIPWLKKSLGLFEYIQLKDRALYELIPFLLEAGHIADSVWSPFLYSARIC